MSEALGNCYYEMIPKVNLAFSQGLLGVGWRWGGMGVGQETSLLWCLGLEEGRGNAFQPCRGFPGPGIIECIGLPPCQGR